MEIRVLGAHSVESSKTGFTSFLIDGVLAVDAGNLCSSLTFKEQAKIKAILLTHAHYDHLRDIPAIGMNMYKMKMAFDIYAPAPVRDVLVSSLMNGNLYPDFTKKPEKDPVIRMRLAEAGKKELITGYEVLPVSMVHAVPSTGYQITSPDGKKVFFTSDTGPGLIDVWRQIKPDVLFSELTLINKEDKFAHESGHLTPALLQKELESFKSIHGYLPRIVLMHMDPFIFEDLKPEIKAVEKTLGIKITLSKEGMKIKV
jgi:ribonuclease BN (tRNA processing enzyme)